MSELDVWVSVSGDGKERFGDVDADHVEITVGEEPSDTARTAADVGNLRDFLLPDELNERPDQCAIDRAFRSGTDFGTYELDVGVSRCVVNVTGCLYVIVVAHSLRIRRGGGNETSSPRPQIRLVCPIESHWVGWRLRI